MSKSGDPHIYLVVIAGGSGTRFWPKSTSKKPKQLLTFQKKTLIEETLDRFVDLIPRNRQMIVTTDALQEAIALKAPDIEILAEPCARSTAPSIFWAAQAIAKKNPDAVMLVMPSDHYIASLPLFHEALQTAIDWASSHDDLVTLGILPTRPETGYGYLRTEDRDHPSKTGKRGGSGSEESDGGRRAVLPVTAFIEKPDLATAHQFLASGRYFWNGGMFIWKTSLILQAFQTWMPEMQAIWEETHQDVHQAFARFPMTSIDYGIMEKAQNVVTVPLSCGWDDLGTWSSLETLGSILKLEQGNNIISQGQLVALESQGNIIDAPGTLVALLGVEDLIIVQNSTTLMIAQKSRAQELKSLVTEVGKINPELI